MRIISISFLLVLILVSISSSQIYLSGELSGTLIDTTYIIEDDIIVSSSLQIEPGAKLRFNDDVVFTVNGDLYALGSENDSIFFELNDGASGWDGIDVLRVVSAPYAELTYCVVTGSNSGGIVVEGVSYISLRNCRIFYNQGVDGGGVSVVGSYNIVSPIEDCIFSNNTGGGISILGSQWNVQIINCDISNNTGTGLRFESDGPETKISNCLISNNIDNSEQGVGGIGILEGTDLDALIEYCLINNNYGTLAGGIFYMHSIGIDHCTIIGNSCDEAGSAIYTIQAYNNVSNCIFDSNQGGLGAIVSYVPIYPDINYNLFFNNSNVCSTYTQGSTQNPYEIIDRINANGDSCDTFYNLYVDPLFLDREAYDFHLQADSPCINAGNPEYPLDGDNSYTDIGAYSFYQSGITESTTDLPVDFGIGKVYPNPFNNQTTIMINVNQPGKVGLYVYDILGRKVQTVTYSYKQSGTFLIPFNGNSLPSGNYFIHYCGVDGYSSRRITLLK